MVCRKVILQKYFSVKSFVFHVCWLLIFQKWLNFTGKNKSSFPKTNDISNILFHNYGSYFNFSEDSIFMRKLEIIYAKIFITYSVFTYPIFYKVKHTDAHSTYIIFLVVYLSTLYFCRRSLLTASYLLHCNTSCSLMNIPYRRNLPRNMRNFESEKVILRELQESVKQLRAPSVKTRK